MVHKLGKWKEKKEKMDKMVRGGQRKRWKGRTIKNRKRRQGGYGDEVGGKRAGKKGVIAG